MARDSVEVKEGNRADSKTFASIVADSYQGEPKMRNLSQSQVQFNSYSMSNETPLPLPQQVPLRPQQ